MSHSTHSIFRCSKLVYKDIGKEIYQIEAPKDFRAPKDWTRLSATGVSLLAPKLQMTLSVATDN